MSVRVVAEAGQCNNGSVTKAIEMAQVADDCGAWGIKFQLLKPETIARADAAKYWYEDGMGTHTQREAFTKAGLVDYGKWREVKEACDDFGIEFLATPFDLEAVEVLYDMGCQYLKIASGDITYRELLEQCAATGLKILLSTGASYKNEIDRALRWLGYADVTLLACTLAYPTPIDSAEVWRVQTLKRAFQRPVGYSDHTSMPETGLAAAACGSGLNEVHFTLDNNAPDVPDHKMAVNPDRLFEYVQASELGARLRGKGLLEPAEDEWAAREGARRSVVAARDLEVGDRIEADDMVFLRPGDGLAPSAGPKIVGKRMVHAVMAGEPIRFEDLEYPWRNV